MRSAATKGSDAVAMTSMPGSLESTSLNVWRTTAESSTIRTRIFAALIAQYPPAIASAVVDPAAICGEAGRSNTSPVPVWN
jgi:hypothetical protein